MIKYISILLLVSFPGFAFAQACPKTRIKEGTPAPCEGFILSPEVMEEATKLPQQISLLNEKLELKDKQLTLRDDKINLLTEFIDKKDKTIDSLHAAFLEKDKMDSLKLGLTVGISVTLTALLSIGLAFAFAKAANLHITQ